MREWTGSCQRCFKDARSYIMSMYSTLLVCMECKDEEVSRDDYGEARDAEETAIKAGDFNFKGVGEPCG